MLDHQWPLTSPSLDVVYLLFITYLDQTSCINRIKTLERSLDFLIECRSPLTVVICQLPESSAGSDALDGSSIQEEAAKLVSIIEARLRATLLALAKISSTQNKNRLGSTLIYLATAEWKFTLCHRRLYTGPTPLATVFYCRPMSKAVLLVL